MNYLKERRLATGLTQDQVAQLADISTSLYCKFEQNKRSTAGMSLKTALLLKEILNLDLYLLLDSSTRTISSISPY